MVIILIAAVWQWVGTRHLNEEDEEVGDEEEEEEK